MYRIMDLNDVIVNSKSLIMGRVSNYIKVPVVEAELLVFNAAFEILHYIKQYTITSK
jgi:hypothetical protein